RGRSFGPVLRPCSVATPYARDGGLIARRRWRGGDPPTSGDDGRWAAPRGFTGARLPGQAKHQDVPSRSASRPDGRQRPARVVEPPGTAEHGELGELREPEGAPGHEPG